MLESAVIVMTVMGCGNQGTNCDFVSSPPQTYESRASCDDAIPNVLMGISDAPYPVLTATCDVKGAALTAGEPVAVARVEPRQRSAEPIKRPEADVLQTQNEPTEDSPILYRLENGYALVRDETVDFASRVGSGTAKVVKRVGKSTADTFESAKDVVVGSTKKVAKGVGKTLNRIGKTIDPRQ